MAFLLLAEERGQKRLGLWILSLASQPSPYIAPLAYPLATKLFERVCG